MIRIRVFLFLFVVFVATSCHRTKRQNSDFPSPQLMCKTAAGSVGSCVPPATCPELPPNAPTSCPLEESGKQGVCCLNPSISDPFAVNPGSVNSEAHLVEDHDLSESSSNAVQGLEQREKLEQTLAVRGLVVRPNTAESLHIQLQFADQYAQEVGRQGLITAETSSDLTNRLKLSPGILPKVNLGQSSIVGACPAKTECPATKYRSFDGSCNNLLNSEWGKSGRAFQRIAPPTYQDGVSKPRVASDGTALPSCRLISTNVIQSQFVEFRKIDALFVTFGQFVDHDLSLTPTSRGANGSGILCCPPTIPLNLRHPECMAIDIPETDPFFKTFNLRCMEFVRTIPAPPPACTLGPREQLNQLTSYVDSSQIYGNTEAQAKALRDTKGGRLLVGGGSVGREFPPHANSGGCSGNVAQGMFCIRAGDVRASEQPMLSALHVAFLREHNRIAAELLLLNPGWSDENLYQESRRIVQAKMQHIIYNEYLPLLLGSRVVKEYDLELHQSGFFNKYDSNVDATIFNEFATAAYRFGHSLVQSQMRLFGANGQITQTQQLRNQFLMPFNVSLLDDYVRGSITQSSQFVDENVSPELTNHLFQRNNQFGLDLAAINCQRGRDHAIATYTQMRKVCGLSPITTFDDLSGVMQPAAVIRFRQIYKRVEDIDLWVGGVSEKLMVGSAVGPTFGCIIAVQFQRLRLGDRFWYERGSTESSFNEAQLIQLRRTSMAEILCENTDIKEIQTLAFLKASEKNLKVSCAKILKTSLRPWKNEPIWT